VTAPASSPLAQYASEGALQDAVVSLAQLLGWLVHHDRGDMRSHVLGNAGFPDLMLAPTRRRLPERVEFAVELKTDRGKLTYTQALWLHSLRRSYLWTPRDWHEGYVEAYLKAHSESDAQRVASEAGWLLHADELREFTQ
jgi:hypothetical protein